MKIHRSHSIGYGMSVSPLPVILWSWEERQIVIGWLFWGINIFY